MTTAYLAAEGFEPIKFQGATDHAPAAAFAAIEGGRCTCITTSASLPSC